MESVRTNLEEWKIRKQQERQDVAGAQKQALEEVISSGQALGSYLIGRGRLGSRLTSGNAALVLQANPLARAVMNYKQWQEFGRNVNKGAAGIPILTRQNGYFAVEKVFDVSQTYGNRPYPALELPASPEQMRQAVKALTSLCPVPVQAQLDLPQPGILFPQEVSCISFERCQIRMVDGAVEPYHAPVVNRPPWKGHKRFRVGKEQQVRVLDIQEAPYRRGIESHSFLKGLLQRRRRYRDILQLPEYIAEGEADESYAVILHIFEYIFLIIAFHDSSCEKRRRRHILTPLSH